MKGSFLKNYRVKLIVVTAASVFWFAVVTENEYEYNIEVPIQILNMSPDKILVGDIPENAIVRFQGKGTALLAMMFSGDSKFTIDLSGIENSENIQLDLGMIQTRQRRLPVTPIQLISPHSILIVIDDYIEKMVPVVSQVNLQTVNGYTVVGEPVLSPDSVVISGPEQILSTIDSVSTVAQEFTNLRRDFEASVPLQPFDDSRQVELTHDSIQLSASIQKVLELTLKEIPVLVENAPDGWIVTPLPSTLSLTVVGGEELLLGLRREDVKAVIHYEKSNKSDSKGYQPVIDVPEGVSCRNIRPVEFKLMMERKRNESTRH